MQVRINNQVQSKKTSMGREQIPFGPVYHLLCEIKRTDASLLPVAT